jgi:ElaB/YqjD/DUF883 family membrane-anchored ribosome-binding protein
MSAADDTNNGAARVAESAERAFADASRKFEQAVSEGIEQIRAQSRAYADTASQQLDEAQRFVVEHVRERPLVTTGVALGVGVLLGLLLSGGRRH